MGIQIGEREIAGILLFVAVLLLVKVGIAASGATFEERPRRVKKVITMEAFDGGGGLRELFASARDSHSHK